MPDAVAIAPTQSVVAPASAAVVPTSNAPASAATVPATKVDAPVVDGAAPAPAFDLRAQMEALLPSPDAAPAAEGEGAPVDAATRRMAALDAKQKKHDATLKQIQHLAQFEKPAEAFMADPIGFMAKAGMSEDAIGQAIVAALERLGVKPPEGGEKPSAAQQEKPQDAKKDELPQLSAADVADLTAKGIAFAGEVAASLGDKADLVRGAVADGFKVKLPAKNGAPEREVPLYEYVIHEVENRYQDALDAGHLPANGLTRAQYRALKAEVISDVNRALEKNPEIVKKHRAPKTEAAPAAEEKETPGALTSSISGAGGQGEKTYSSEAEWRAARLARIAQLKPTQAVRRGR